MPIWCTLFAMRVLIVTPLFPPDIAEPAPYVKELASLLSLNQAVTILAFNHIPEQITGVQIIPIEKSDVLPIRLFRYLQALIRAAHDADMIYVQNGPSVELPVLLFSFFTRIPIYLRLGDEVSLTHAATHSLLGWLLRQTISRARGIIVHTRTSNASAFFMKNIPPERIHNMERPLSRPEILPFTPFPTEAMSAYETSWSTHIADLSNMLHL